MAKPTQPKDLSGETPLADAARLYVAARLADARRFEGAVRETPEDRSSADAVHDMRVAMRRLRAALKLGGAALHPSERAAKRLQDALGDVRDAQLHITWLEAALREAERAGAKEASASQRRRRADRNVGNPAQGEAEAIAELLALREERLRNRGQNLRAALERWGEAEPKMLGALERVDAKGKLAGHRARGRLARKLRDVQERMRAARQSLEPIVAHALRIAVKKLRYDAELLQPALPGPCAAVLRELPQLQEKLGELHDADVRLAFLEHAGNRELRVRVATLRVRELGRRGRLAHEVSQQLGRWRDESVPRKLRGLLRA